MSLLVRFLCVSTLTGAALAGHLVMALTGAASVRARWLAARSERICALNGGYPVTAAKAAESEVRAACLDVFRPRLRLRSTDLMWAHGAQRTAAEAASESERLTMCIVAQVLAGGSDVGSMLALAEDVETQAASAVVGRVARIEAAATWPDLRSASRSAVPSPTRQLLRLWTWEPARTVGAAVVKRCLDAISRGATFGLLAAVVVSAGVLELDEIATSAGTLGVLGAAAGSTWFTYSALEARSALAPREWIARLAVPVEVWCAALAVGWPLVVAGVWQLPVSAIGAS
jgi:hypothetical protein